MKAGFAASAVSILWLLASLALGMPVWVIAVGLIAGLAGSYLPRKGRSLR